MVPGAHERKRPGLNTYAAYLANTDGYEVELIAHDS
jgi:hypothetical protein